jgi:phosphoribosylformimino-5-aminoimidazole carboxamide ribotide isomerase
MIAIPAVDLRAGRCVQLVGGDYAQERVRLDDPVAVARDWVRAGFARLHVVDLDAATGRGGNRALIGELLREVARETGGAVPVQVGGGVREGDDIAALLDEGAAAVVVGTRAVEDAAWRETMALRFPGQLVLAADVRGRQVVTRGWSSTSMLDVGDLVRDCAGLPLAALLVTAVQLEGRMEGTDLPLMEEIAEQAAAPLLASGGVASADDLRALAHRGVAGAVLGMALYTGALDARHTAEEFGA